MEIEFERGDQVEVCSKEDGFLGSYFGATVLKKLSNGSFYEVKYKNLITDEDEPHRLVETIAVDELSPMPPKSLQVMFRLHDKVDALDKDGWWTGEVTGRTGNMYSVYFETTNEVLEYPLYRLRRHFDFVNGDWVSSATRQY